MMKRTFSILFVLLAVLSSAFAGGGNDWGGGGGGSSNGDAKQFASVMTGKGLGATSFDITQTYSMPGSPKYNNSEDNALFTFLTTIEKPSAGERTGYSNKSFDLHITPYGENSDGFYFIHESNKTKKVDYSLGAVAFKGTYEGNYTDDATLQNSGYTLKKTSATDYTLTFPGVEFSKPYYVRAKDMWMYKVFLLMSPASEADLEEGMYTSYIKVSLTVTGNNTRHMPEGGLSIDVIYCIRAHYGVDMQDVEMEVFSVVAGPDAYNMDLQDGLHHNVMSIYLYSADPEGAATETTADKQRYKVYISSSPDYNDTGHFVFRQLGTEHLSEDMGANAVEYNLFITTNEDSAKTQFPTSTSGTTTKSGTQGIKRLSSGQFYLYPAFENFALRSTSHTYLWSLQADIWVKVTGTTTNLHSGLYQSNLYVIVETTT